MQPHSLHGRNGHDFLARSVVGLEHGVKHALQETDLIGGVGRCELCDRIACRIDECVYTLAGSLMVCAADLEVEW